MHCQCLTKVGSKCKRLALSGSKYCYQHRKCKTTKKIIKTELVVGCPFQNQNKKKKIVTLYDKLGGIFGIAAVVNHFSDEILKNPIVGVNSENPQLRKWSRDHTEDRLPGLKWLRTLWVTDLVGGGYKFKATRQGQNQFDLSCAHKGLKITSKEFDEVAKILATSLDHFNVGEKEKNEILSVFSAHKHEVVQG